MSRFPSDGHLISWAGLCPRSDESAGKRRSNRLRKGAPWLKTTLVQCAWPTRHKQLLERDPFALVQAIVGDHTACRADSYGCCSARTAPLCRVRVTRGLSMPTP